MIEAAFASRRGVRKRENQDCIGAVSRLWQGDTAGPQCLTIRATQFCLAVADGLGGHEHGSRASALAIETLLQLDLERASKATVGEALRLADRRLITTAAAEAQHKPMGCSVAGVVGIDGRLIGFSAGDCMLTAWRRGALINRTTPDRDASDKKLFQCLGGTFQLDSMTPHVFDIAGAEAVWLCSDGVSDMLDLTKLGDVALLESTVALAEILAHVERAGRPDDATILVASGFS